MCAVLFAPGKPWRDKATKAAIKRIAEMLRSDIANDERNEVGRRRAARVRRYKQKGEV